MNCLDEFGLADNTIVVYGSDCGDWLAITVWLERADAI